MIKIDIKVLLVEDSPTDADLIQEGLDGAGIGRVDITHVETLADALAHLKSQEAVDSILLDLGLPDSQGLDTLHDMLKHSGDIPVIVLTGLADDEVGREAVRSGADDYLVKGGGANNRSNLITRSICFALERHKLRSEVDAAKAQSGHDNQVKQLSDIGKGQDQEEPLALSERAPKEFKAFVSSYNNILSRLTDKQSDFDMRNDLETLANDMGAQNAGPHDVVEVYSTTLKAMVKDSDSNEVSALVEEGHVTSLGLMGMLVSHYRRGS